MTRKHNVNITQNAQDDLEYIYDYISSDNFINATNFILELEEEIYSLEILPNRNPLIAENEYFDTNYRHLIYKKHRIVYRIIDNSVFILRIIRGSKLLEL